MGAQVIVGSPVHFVFILQQAITLLNSDLLSIQPLGLHFNEIQPF